MEPEVSVVLFVAAAEFVRFQQSPPLLFPPPEGLTELPVCPVCLERLDDAASGIVTIQCNHSFHCQCLSKWKGDNSCPVCRFCQNPDSESPLCAVCQTTESLWICLICGHVGCGRYVNEHAREHYKQSLHAYALELQTSRVWDYAGDGYVHRLVQNKSDGKLVQLPQPEGESESAEETPVPESKVESISLEYSYLLEAQRSYFQEQLKRIERQKAAKVGHLEEEFAHLLGNKEIQEQRIKGAEEEKRKLERKSQTLEKKLKDAQKEIEFMKEINDALKSNQEQWKEKIEEMEKKLKDDSKDKKIQEMEEQIQDLMFFIEAKKKIESDEELQNASVVVGASPNTTPTKRKPKGKNKR